MNALPVANLKRLYMLIVCFNGGVVGCLLADS